MRRVLSARRVQAVQREPARTIAGQLEQVRAARGTGLPLSLVGAVRRARCRFGSSTRATLVGSTLTDGGKHATVVRVQTRAAHWSHAGTGICGSLGRGTYRAYMAACSCGVW